MQPARPLTKPTKQRRLVYEAADHVRHKLLAAHLSPGLRGTHIVKSLPVRSGDTIRVMRGDHKGFEGKITRIDVKKYRIYVEGLTREKVDGTTIFVPVHPSKVTITRLNLDDKWRRKILERKQKAQKKPELEAVQKTPETQEPEEPSKEKVAAIRKYPKKGPTKRGRKAKKEAKTKEEAQAEEPEADEEPKTQRTKGRRRPVKKAEEEE